MTDLENKIGYHFKNKDLLSEALTHSSYANERKAQHIKYNERLEFLGDAVLSIVVSDYIFSHCPELPEGELTKLRASLVCEKSLFEFAKKIDLGSYLILSKGERNNGGAERPSILSDAFEALIAAIYIDGGMEPAAKHIRLPVLLCVAAAEDDALLYISSVGRDHGPAGEHIPQVYGVLPVEPWQRGVGPG